jgi:DNA-binding PadR family transcriptional regulator
MAEPNHADLTSVRRRIQLTGLLQKSPVLRDFSMSEKRHGKTREQTHYTFTEKGLAALREWLGRPSSFPRIQSEAVARVLASDLAEDERVVAESIQALRLEIADLLAGIDEDERRAPSIPHRQRQLKVVRSLGRRLLLAHLDWIDEVEHELGRPAREQAPATRS